MTFSSGSGLAGLTFAGGTTALSGSNGELFKLVSSPTAEQFAVTISPANAYWTGAQGTSSWSTLVSGSNTNWGSTASGPDTNLLPGGGYTNVFFTASAASNYANTTLDGNFTINSLTFNATPAAPLPSVPEAPVPMP